MVSGLVTSPCDHDRIFSGLARLMRIESKSAIWLARSYGLERYNGCLLPRYAGAKTIFRLLTDAQKVRRRAANPRLRLSRSAVFAASSTRHLDTGTAIRARER